MRTSWFIATLALSLYVSVSVGQTSKPSISEMRWGRDFKLHVKLSNDTNYVMDVRALHHAEEFNAEDAKEATTYYPVNLDEEFIEYIKTRKLKIDENTKTDTVPKGNPKTLWSALHRTLGGGYVHFVNSLIYSLESQQLNLYDPIMKRPVTTWKPKPKTKTWKRTRNWVHYIPSDQKLAQVEYKRRKKEKDLQDLQGVPTEFIEQFLLITQKEYDEMLAQGQRMQLSKIDLVRLLLGAKYLGEHQIEFIQSRVSSSVLRYNISNLPSVIIFDDYNAAVAMTLDNTGYKIDYVVFSDQDTISSEEQMHRIDKIEALIITINEANDRVFQRRLSTYYGS
ncbi:MAG: hypothetical protein RBR68_11185 [Tenuifilaceae bacterium]|nr:hypothetical protein [Tenuifilaceae bacterium]